MKRIREVCRPVQAGLFFEINSNHYIIMIWKAEKQAFETYVRQKEQDDEKQA